MPDLVFKSVCLFNLNQVKFCLLKATMRNMFTVNNKDTRTTPLTSLILNIANIDILNIKQLSKLILVHKLLTLKVISYWEE